MATAYAALVSLLNDLELIQNHPCHSFSFDNNQIQSLLERVRFLIDFMETCDYHALEKRIAVAAHAAEVVIHSHVAGQIHSGSTLREKTVQQSCFLLDLQKAIKDMDLQEVQNTPSSSSPLSATAAAASSSSAAAAPLTSQKNTMVGFDEVLYQLLELLVGEAGRRVIPIIAMGGAGKTTLARNAFQHNLVLEHFDVRLWATISQQYDVGEILNQLLGSKTIRISG